MKNLKIPNWLYLIILAGSAILIYSIFNSRNDVRRIKKEAEKEIKAHKDSIKILYARLKVETETVDDFTDSLRALNKKCEKKKKKSISRRQNDSLEKEEIRKGIKMFGAAGIKIEQSPMAATFGNRAFDNLGVLILKSAGDEKIKAIYKGITKHQDTIIKTQDITIKKIVKEVKKTYWAGFKTGGFLGSLLTLIGVVALLL